MKKRLIFAMNVVAYMLLTSAMQCNDDCYDEDYWFRQDESLEEHDQEIFGRDSLYIPNLESMQLVQPFVDSLYLAAVQGRGERRSLSGHISDNSDFFLTNDARAEWLPFLRVIPLEPGNSYLLVPAHRQWMEHTGSILMYSDTMSCNVWQLRHVVEAASRLLASSDSLSSLPMSQWSMQALDEAFRLVSVNMDWNLSD